MSTITDDGARLRATADYVRRQDTETLFSRLLPQLDALELRALADRCRFSHAALLVFPESGPALRAMLAECGLDPDTPPAPSVVVRQRLAERHGRDAAGLEVGILRPTVPGPDGEPRSVEVFTLSTPAGSELAALAAQERAREQESHLAFEVRRPDPLALRGLRALLTHHGAGADGGGYNPHEDGTVFYFTAPEGSKAGYGRVELYVPGDHREVLAEHLAEHRTRRPAETLLRQLTGAWTTQALAVFARLGVPDLMPAPFAETENETSTGTGPGTGPGTDAAVTVDALAQRVGADPDALGSLLRYLAALGVVLPHGEGYRLSPTGALLRADAPGSMRPLALLYGGPFYESFGGLEHTLRTGEVAFDQIFGENHFDHFARRPELAELFDRSMAAGSRMFEPLTAHPAITAAANAPHPATVVDVAGGNGELLGRLLSAHRRLRGVLLERPHAVEAARTLLDAAGCGERVGYVTGDFADVPAGADVYLLVRILHDWDDERCGTILRALAAAMPLHAELLVVERLLPSDGSASLATAWDLHMRCNVGGRERELSHYARLFADAGLTLVSTAPLPLDGYALRVRRADAVRPEGALS